MSIESAPEVHRRRYLITATVTLAAVLELLDASIVNVAISRIMASFGATLDEVAWVSTGYVIANAIVLPLGGWFCDYFGRRRYFAASVALFTLSSFFCGNAGSLRSLVLWRIVQGLGGGGLLATAQATLHDVFPRRELGFAMALFGLGVMVGPAVGPTLGGFITDTYAWPWIFYINLPLGALALLLTLAYVPDSPHGSKPGRVDVAGFALLALGLGSLQAMLARGGRQGWWESPEIVACGVVGVASLIVFALRELQSAHPIVGLRILANRTFAAGVACSFSLGMAMYATLFLLPVYLQEVLGFGARDAGLAILPAALATGLTMGVAGGVARRCALGPRSVLFIGVCVFGVSMWLHGRFGLHSTLRDFVVPMILRGIGLGLIFQPLTALTMAGVAASQVGKASGLYNLTRQLGGSVGIAIGATLFMRLSPAPLFMFFALLLMLSTPLLLLMGPDANGPVKQPAES